MVFSPSVPHRLVDYTLTPSHRISLSISLSRATGPISHLKEAAPEATKEEAAEAAKEAAPEVAVEEAAEAANQAAPDVEAANGRRLGALLGSICAPNANARPTCV
jgi:hypothetical protein